MFDVIIVLGMHRSGTSAVAGVLGMLGGTTPKHLLAADADNPTGYFESAPLLQFHEELLSSAGTFWHDCQRIEPKWFESRTGKSFIPRALKLFAAEFDHAGLPVLKDPRICRFALFWINALKKIDATPRFVIPIRSPLEVAQSLKTRDEISISNGLLIWLRHVLDAEFQSRGEARSFFTWNQFISNWRSVAKKISDDTGIIWPRLSKQKVRRIEKYLSKDLIHHRVDDTELAAHSDSHEWVNTTYNALLELTHNPRSKSAQKILNHVRSLFDQSSDLFGPPLRDSEVELWQKRALASSLKEEGTQSKAKVLGTLKKTESEMHNVINSHAASIRSLETTLDRTKNENDRLVADFHRISREVQQLLIASDSRAANMEASHARIFSETQERHDANIRALRDQLVDAEAAAARWAAMYEDKNGWSAFQPKKYQLRRLERELTRSGLFDAEWYLTEYKDAAENGRTPARHYLEVGYSRGYQPNPYFDTRWYLDVYDDVRRSGMNPLLHYVRHGYSEGRDPGPEFQTDFYLASNPDVRLSGINPLAHYLLHGRAEGRLPVKP